jgi:hypothetical protein
MSICAFHVLLGYYVFLYTTSFTGENCELCIAIISKFRSVANNSPGKYEGKRMENTATMWEIFTGMGQGLI